MKHSGTKTYFVKQNLFCLNIKMEIKWTFFKAAKKHENKKA